MPEGTVESLETSDLGDAIYQQMLPKIRAMAMEGVVDLRLDPHRLIVVIIQADDPVWRRLAESLIEQDAGAAPPKAEGTFGVSYALGDAAMIEPIAECGGLDDEQASELRQEPPEGEFRVFVLVRGEILSYWETLAPDPGPRALLS